MTTTATRTLPGRYAYTDGATVRPTQAVTHLASIQVQALLQASPAFHQLSAGQQAAIEDDLTKIAAYEAALVHDGFAQTQRLGQVPVASGRTASRALEDPPPPPPPPPDTFDTRATGRVADVTRDTLNAIAFPTFVADLIKGTFNAIVDASIQQMEAFGRLLANVAKTVDQFMADNITDNQARDYLTSSYPGHFALSVEGDAPRVTARSGADELTKPDFKTDLGLTDDVEISDESAEEVLVPAARRKLAAQRHELLSTMVLMGINRIVVTSGRVRARLDFHIAAQDQAKAASASQFDFHHDSVAAGWFGFGGGAQRTSVAYVNTNSREATDNIEVSANLMGELDLKFKSETFPLERFADTSAVSRIQAGTRNPGGNPVGQALTQPREAD